MVERVTALGIAAAAAGCTSEAPGSDALLGAARSALSSPDAGGTDAGGALCISGAPPYPIQVPIVGQTTIRSNLSNQTLYVTGTYLSSDPGEAQEGESLVVTSGAQPPWIAPVNGPANTVFDIQAQSTDLTGYIIGADGDESATVSAYSFGADTNISPQQKVPPSYGFYAGRLGAAPDITPNRQFCEVNGTCQFMDATADKVGWERTYAYWTLGRPAAQFVQWSVDTCLDMVKNRLGLSARPSLPAPPGWVSGPALTSLYHYGACQAAALKANIDYFNGRSNRCRVNSRVLFVDLEERDGFDNAEFKENSAMVQGFADEVSVLGVALGVYTRPDFWNSHIGKASFSFAPGFVFWAAGLGADCRFSLTAKPMSQTVLDPIVTMYEQLREDPTNVIAGMKASIWQYSPGPGSCTCTCTADCPAPCHPQPELCGCQDLDMTAEDPAYFVPEPAP
jgi:hypothetical protein